MKNEIRSHAKVVYLEPRTEIAEFRQVLNHHAERNGRCTNLRKLDFIDRILISLVSISFLITVIAQVYIKWVGPIGR